MNDKEYLEKIKRYILAAAIIFLMSVMTGIIITEKTVEGKDIAKNITKEMIEIKRPTPFLRMIEIFETNIYNSIMALLFGVGSIYTVIINGVAIGSVINFISKMHGGLLFTILIILPHGIIEISAIIISTGIGIRFGHMMYNYIIDKTNIKDIKRELIYGIRFYIKWIVPMILLAAFIEAYITPIIV